ncbi:hypothetical protein ACQZV8_17115 [Magnetococcales bacterium HHB-1]
MRYTLSFMPWIKNRVLDRTSVPISHAHQIIEEEEVHDSAIIHSIFQEAQQKAREVKLTFADEENSFIAHMVADEGKSSHQQTVSVGVLKPALGNLKMVTHKQVEIQFETAHHLCSATVDVLYRHASGFHVLQLPEVMALKAQKRRHFRVRIDEGLLGQVEIIRPSGVSFTGELLDISVSGFSFCSIHEIPELFDGAKIELLIKSTGFPGRDLCAHILTATECPLGKQGVNCYRAKFALDNAQQQRMVEQFVANIQRTQIKKRRCFH